MLQPDLRILRIVPSLRLGFFLAQRESGPAGGCLGPTRPPATAPGNRGLY